MDRQFKEDNERIEEIMQHYVEEGKRKCLFCVVANGSSRAVHAVGDAGQMFVEMSKAWGSVLVERCGINDPDELKTVLDNLADIFRKAVWRAWEKRQQAPDLSAELEDPEEKLRDAILGQAKESEGREPGKVQDQEEGLPEGPAPAGD